jgi:NAD+ synthase (glutamine-hydrolysing)
MDFYNAYSQGFVRVAACTHHTTIGDPAANAASVLGLARECHDDGVALAVFPELTLSGYSIEDTVLQEFPAQSRHLSRNHERGWRPVKPSAPRRC